VFSPGVAGAIAFDFLVPEIGGALWPRNMLGTVTHIAKGARMAHLLSETLDKYVRCIDLPLIFMKATPAAP
jgi:hypothetical protein